MVPLSCLGLQMPISQLSSGSHDLFGDLANWECADANPLSGAGYPGCSQGDSAVAIAFG